MKLVHSLVIWAYMVSLVLAHYFAIGTNSGKQQRNQTVDKPDADDIIIKLKPGGTFEDVVEICDKHPKFTIGRQVSQLNIHVRVTAQNLIYMMFFKGPLLPECATLDHDRSSQ